jgi:hypothetical protein
MRPLFPLSSIKLFFLQMVKASYGSYNGGFYCPSGRRSSAAWNRDPVHGGADNDFRHTVLIQTGIGRRKYLVGLKNRAEEEDERPWFYAPFANRIEETLHIIAQGGLIGAGPPGAGVSLRHRHLLLQALGAGMGAPTTMKYGEDQTVASEEQGLGRIYTGQG